MIPSDAFSDSRTRVLLAVTWLRRPTVRRVAQEAGISATRAYLHLRALEADGLVAWDLSGGRGAGGTLRALVEEWWF